MPNAGLPAYWYLNIPDLVLAAITYLLLARLVLGAMLDSDNTLMRGLAAVTSPVTAAVGALTPRIVPAPLVLAFAMLWLFGARILVFIATSAIGLRF